MSDALFTAADAYSGDPLDPDLITPTPAEVVAGLSLTDRLSRLDALEQQASDIVEQAMDLAGHKILMATCVLFSGGNDSTTLAHMFRDMADYAIHVNTTIGIEQTRQYVRDTCAAWGLDLIERRPPQTFRELVVERGLPGPAMHWKMYSRLKERALDLVRYDLGIANSRSHYALWLAGRRRSESERRENIPLHERDGSVIWASPIAMWTKLDLQTYRLKYPDVPRNEVSDLLHMSGECLCGAFAKPGELDEIAYWFPDVAAEIRDIEKAVREAGHLEPFCRWGHGQGNPSNSGRLCSSCQIPGQQEMS